MKTTIRSAIKSAARQIEAFLSSLIDTRQSVPVEVKNNTKSFIDYFVRDIRL
jgi:hypothetical protein